MITNVIPAASIAIVLLGPVLGFAQSVCGNGTVEMGEQCDGGACCTPGCTFVAAGTVCRPRATTCGDGDDACLCDAVEVCTGSSAACPADGLEVSGTVCRPSAKDLLNCPDPDPITNCPDTGCDVAEACTGMDPACPADQFEPDTTLCRMAQGVCDLDDFCTGQHAFCLPDTKSTAVCRPSAGLCDPAESCSGRENDCPPDAIQPAGTICRPAAGACDVAETCTGGPACPADALVAGGTECRAAAGSCDVAEDCTGSSAACPANGFVAAGTECRPSLDVTCDPAEACTGSGPQCPANAFTPDGTACDDGMACTIPDACTAGQCVGNSMICGDGTVQLGCNEECDDGNTTSGDGCSSTCQSQPGLGCPFTPLAGCRLPVLPVKSTIEIIDRERIGGLKFKWRWRKGAATDVAEFGDPLATTSYQLCIYDQGMLLTGSTAPAGGTCGVTHPKPCWRRRGANGFRYRDVSQSILPGGINRVSLKAGKDSKAEVQVHATGGIFEFPSNGGLGLPDLAAIQQPLRIQVQNTNGLCFEAAFNAPPGRQDPNRFEDVGD
jgi:cysteine-rich repeat protein